MENFDQISPQLIRVQQPSDFPIMDVADVVAMEKHLEASGTSLLTLMNRAGASVADLVRELSVTSDPIVVLAGNGNNGGDGWVAAKLLADRGYRVDLITAKDPSELKAEPARQAALHIVGEASDNLRVNLMPSAIEARSIIYRAGIIIDALLGTGFDGETLKEPFSAWVNLANESEGRIISADVPSGLSAQSGKHADPTIVADATVTMLALKPGLVNVDASSFVGDLYLAPLRD